MRHAHARVARARVCDIVAADRERDACTGSRGVDYGTAKSRTEAARLVNFVTTARVEL